jgi:hypothetical protein
MWWETRGRIEAVYTDKPSDRHLSPNAGLQAQFDIWSFKRHQHIGDGTMTFEEPASIDLFPGTGVTPPISTTGCRTRG